MSDTDVAVIVEMERAALGRWAKGDPGGFLEITDGDVTYFDPFQVQRIESKEGLEQLYKTIWGKVKIIHWEMLKPRVQEFGDTAVLTFRFASDDAQFPVWHTTEVYRHGGEGWRIVHTHWSVPAG